METLLLYVIGGDKLQTAGLVVCIDMMIPYIWRCLNDYASTPRFASYKLYQHSR